MQMPKYVVRYRIPAWFDERTGSEFAGGSGFLFGGNTLDDARSVAARLFEGDPRPIRIRIDEVTEHERATGTVYA
jgi:hypothetical protein